MQQVVEVKIDIRGVGNIESYISNNYRLNGCVTKISLESGFLKIRLNETCLLHTIVKQASKKKYPSAESLANFIQNSLGIKKDGLASLRYISAVELPNVWLLFFVK